MEFFILPKHGSLDQNKLPKEEQKTSPGILGCLIKIYQEYKKDAKGGWHLKSRYLNKFVNMIQLTLGG